MKANTKRIITFITGVALSFSVGYMLNPEAKKNENIIDTDLVTVKYYEVGEKFGGGGYDILITPKNGTNVTTMFDMKDTEYYRDAYLIGHSRDQAMQHYATAKETFNIDWPFTWGK